MPLYSFEGLTPKVHETAFIAPTATLVGDVIVEEGASVWYGAVLRADYAPVVVRARRERPGRRGAARPARVSPPRSAPGATVAHNCVVHGAILGEECLIANGSIVLDGAHDRRPALVAAGSVVAAGRDDPGGDARGRRAGGGEASGRRLVGRVLGRGEPAGLRRARPAPPRRHRVDPRLTRHVLASRSTAWVRATPKRVRRG